MVAALRDIIWALLGGFVVFMIAYDCFQILTRV